MEAANCVRCGRVFTRVKRSICPACEKEDEATFELVRTFLKENPHQSVQQVADETGVSAKRIIQYIRDGRLEITTGMSEEICCTQCGKPIRTGNFCEQCAMHIKTNVLKRPNAPPSGNRKGRMHAIDLNK